MKYSRLVFLLTAGLVLLTSACGWQLRGKDSASEVGTGSVLEEQTKTATSSGSTKRNSTGTITSKEVSAKKQAGRTAKVSPTESEEGIRLVIKNRNHGLAAAMKRIAWENKFDFASNGHTWLVIENEKLEKRPLTVTETGVAAQYQLILTISFSQQDANGTILRPRQQIVSWRSYDFDAKLIVAKAQEEEALIVEMREELAQRMLALLQK